MIKIQNNTATRALIPAFLQGLAPESLADLSWTDPALGVQDCAWWPEVDRSAPLGEFEKYGAETFAVDTENQQVIVTRAIVPMDQDEIDQIEAERRRAQNASILEQINKLESRQSRAVREALLGMDGATVRLQALEGDIAALRAQLV